MPLPERLDDSFAHGAILAFSPGMRVPWKILAVLVVIWAVAMGVVHWARSAKPTAGSLIRYISAHPLAGLSPADRQKVLDETATRLNTLDFDQRQLLRESSMNEEYFRQLTEEERLRFLNATLPEGFHQLMMALNKMDPEKRRKLVDRALADIERDSPRIRERLDNAEVQKMIGQGMDSFYKDANSEVKLEFAPVIEELQRATRGMR